VADISELARRFAASGHDDRSQSPFYASLTRHIAEDPEIVALLTAAPEEQQLPALLLAAVHSMLLADPGLELAQWYPTTTSQPLGSDPFPAFARLCADRSDEIRGIIASHSVQTNEVGRSALLLPAVTAGTVEGVPVSLVDIGTSAGLNLSLDRYEYRYDPGGHIGSPAPVRIECSTRGTVPVSTTIPVIARRVGADRHPIDVTEPDAARWLMACVWPDQAARFERLRAALAIAHESPPEIVAGDAVDLLPGLVRSAAEHGHPVVTNSWVLNYLTPAAQRSYVAALHDLGRQLDLTWAYAESPGLCPNIPFPIDLRGEHITTVMVTTWRGGTPVTQFLGTAHPHGSWWHGPDVP